MKDNNNNNNSNSNNNNNNNYNKNIIKKTINKNKINNIDNTDNISNINNNNKMNNLKKKINVSDKVKNINLMKLVDKLYKNSNKDDKNISSEDKMKNKIRFYREYFSALIEFKALYSDNIKLIADEKTNKKIFSIKINNKDSIKNINKKNSIKDNINNMKKNIIKDNNIRVIKNNVNLSKNKLISSKEELFEKFLDDEIKKFYYASGASKLNKPLSFIFKTDLDEYIVEGILYTARPHDMFNTQHSSFSTYYRHYKYLRHYKIILDTWELKVYSTLKEAKLDIKHSNYVLYNCDKNITEFEKIMKRIDETCYVSEIKKMYNSKLYQVTYMDATVSYVVELCKHINGHGREENNVMVVFNKDYFYWSKVNIDK